MIGSLRGTVLERGGAGEVLVEVNGVGYRAFLPTGAYASLEPGHPTFLFTHLHVREDAMVLYGFPTRDERDTFEALIGTSGVGPKLALAMLSVHSPHALRRALVDDDLDALTLVPGVGKRTAQRLLIELKARLDVRALDLAATPGPTSGATSTARAEVREALTGLGYSADEVRDALAQLADVDLTIVDSRNGTVDDASVASVESMLRDALKLLAVARR